MRDLAGKTAVVTGAAGGIGRAVAGRLVGEGMRVVLVDVDRAVETAAVELGPNACAVAADVASPDDWQRVHDVAAEVHLLVNNAGVIVPHSRPVWEVSERDWRWLIDVNLLGAVNGIRTCVPHMLAHGQGHVVNVSSIAGLGMGRHAYGVSKIAVTALTEALYHQLAGRVGVTLVCPAFVATGLLEQRHRPGGPDPTVTDESWGSVLDRTRGGVDPDVTASAVVDAVTAGRFYAVDESWDDRRFRQWADRLVAGKPPRWKLEKRRR